MESQLVEELIRGVGVIVDDEIDAGEGVDVVFGDALPQGINDLIEATFPVGYIPEDLVL